MANQPEKVPVVNVSKCRGEKEFHGEYQMTSRHSKHLKRCSTKSHSYGSNNSTHLQIYEHPVWAPPGGQAAACHPAQGPWFGRWVMTLGVLPQHKARGHTQEQSSQNCSTPQNEKPLSPPVYQWINDVCCAAVLSATAVRMNGPDLCTVAWTNAQTRWVKKANGQCLPSAFVYTRLLAIVYHPYRYSKILEACI